MTANERKTVYKIKRYCRLLIYHGNDKQIVQRQLKIIKKFVDCGITSYQLNILYVVYGLQKHPYELAKKLHLSQQQLFEIIKSSVVLMTEAAA